MIDRRIAALGLAAIGLTACGGSSSNASGTSAFRSRVDALCATNNAKVRALPAGTENTLSGLRQLDAIATSTLTQIEALKPPSSLAAKFGAYLSGVKQEAAVATKVIDDLAANNLNGIKALAPQIQSLNTASNAAARAMGVPTCAAVATPGGK
jgi:hypothetical protein